MALHKRWIKVLLACQSELGYQIKVKRNLIRSLVGFEHNAMHIEDCECLIERILILMRAERLLVRLQKDLLSAIDTLDETKKKILRLRHKEYLEYQDIALRSGLKVRSVFYQYNKAVELILRKFTERGYTDTELLEGLQGDSLIIDGFCKNEVRERRVKSVRCGT